MTKSKLKIVKIPMDKSDKIDKPAVFPPMSNLFLEYFENKNKLRKDYVNKGYKKNDIEKSTSVKQKPIHKNSAKRNPVSTRDAALREETKQRAAPSGGFADEPESQSVHTSVEPSKPKPALSTVASSEPDTGRFFGTPKIDKNLTQIIKNVEYGYHGDDEDGENEFDNEDIIDINALRNRLSEIETHREEQMSQASDASDTDSDISEASDLFSDMSDDKSIEKPHNRDDDAKSISDASSISKYATPRDKRGYVNTEDKETKPKLNYDGMKEEEEKRELLFKFDMLRRSYPQGNVHHNFDIKSNLDTMKAAYEMHVRRLSMDTTVEKYKSYLMAAFMAVEYACGHFLGLDMQGYTQQQILQMSSYEKLLVELGEKSYVPKGISKFPVEVRLLFMVLMNAAIFIGSKMLMAKTGANLLNMMNSMNAFKRQAQRPPPRASAPMGQPGMNRRPMPMPMPQRGQANRGGVPFGKRKMRGPNINVGDL